MLTRRCGWMKWTLVVAGIAAAGVVGRADPREESAPVSVGPAVGSSAPAGGSGSPRAGSIVIEDCRTWFPYRRRLASERSGILAEAPDEGDRFEPGAVVARLKDDVPRAALAAAEKKASNDADVRQALKAHELAKFSYDRMQAANKSRPGTFAEDEVRQRELDTASTSLRVDVARHELEVAQLEAAQARAELATYEIRTERGGIVTRVIKHDGEGVQLGEEVLEIVDTSVLRVEGFARAERDAPLKPGAPVQVELLGPSGRLAARLATSVGFVDVSQTSGGEVRLWADVSPAPPFIIAGGAAAIYAAVSE
jgi:hypothetical protein